MNDSSSCRVVVFFFFNDTATTEIYTLSLHDALPISPTTCSSGPVTVPARPAARHSARSEEHTSELQSRFDLVCRLLLEKKKIRTDRTAPRYGTLAGDPATAVAVDPSLVRLELGLGEH